MASRKAFRQEPIAVGVCGEADGDATLCVARDGAPMRGGDVLAEGRVDVEAFPVQQHRDLGYEALLFQRVALGRAVVGGGRPGFARGGVDHVL